MAEQLVEALSGTEIIEDVLGQIRLKLLSSCDLRDMDSYGQGYSGEIKISLKMYGMDVREEHFTVPITAKTEPPQQTDGTDVIPIQVEETLEIPQELDLEIVRERLKADAPQVPSDPTEEARMPARLKRKYTRRSVLETTPMGGAVDMDEAQ